MYSNKNFRQRTILNLIPIDHNRYLVKWLLISISKEIHIKTLALATIAVVSLSSMLPATAEPLILNKPTAKNVTAYCDYCGSQDRYYRYYYQPYRQYYYNPGYYYSPYRYDSDFWWW